MTAQNKGQDASPLRLGIAGLGTVGTGTVRIIQNHAALLATGPAGAATADNLTAPPPAGPPPENWCPRRPCALSGSSRSTP